MPYTIKHDPEIDIINLKFTGEIDREDISQATSECLALQKKTRVLRFLVELNGWEVFASFVDIYKLAYEQYVAEAAHRLSRIAVVLPTTPSGQAAANFYETVNRQRFSRRLEASSSIAFQILPVTAGRYNRVGAEYYRTSRYNRRCRYGLPPG
jgi:hypothetical protein